jgi:nitrite reductase (NO-forming)/hydroxylamine reductase
MRSWKARGSVVGAALVCFVACDKKPAPGTGPAASGSADGDPLAKAGETIFNTQCQACHSIGQGDRAGPDLKDVAKRRPKDWLVKWLKDPVTMGQNDPVGKELVAKFKTPMPNLNLKDDQIEQVLAYVELASSGGAKVTEEKFVELTGEDFDKAKSIYFQRCSGCHGTLRAGATGPNIQPERTRKIGTAALKSTLTNGLPGGMPPWGRIGVLNEQEIALMASYVQMSPPEPPPLPMEQIKASWKLEVPPEQRPKKPETKRNWQNYFGVVLRDAGQVAIVDGDTKEKVAIIPTGYAVHILRSSSSGRYFYAVGRDGKVSLIDLWPETPQLVAQVQGCFDARSVDGSKAKGWEDKLVIEGCYWPPQYVVYDGLTLEPKGMQNVLTPAYDTKEELKEVRVASIVASHTEPLWVINLKESGHVALVDYSKPDFPIVQKFEAERFLHDGGWDHTGRYFMVAANMRDSMVVIDVKEKKFLTKFKTGTKPHPGRGANWEDPQYGWVNATTHIGEPKLTVYGADPAKHPEHAWKVVREVKVGGPGSLFVKTHKKSPWVWMDSPLSNKEEETRQLCVYNKKEAKIEKCWTPFERGRVVHFEYDKDGGEVWVSGWDKKGALIIYDDKTLTEKKRIEEDWVVTPTGKFNVWNTAHDVY